LEYLDAVLLYLRGNIVFDIMKSVVCIKRQQ